MKLLTISGSARNDSSNAKLLDALPALFPSIECHRFKGLKDLPLFHADLQEEVVVPSVREWKNAVADADALIVCTPEYIHNIPALLKNALEWLTASGELAGKKVLAITLTPHPPRGDKAMKSLLWSLQALDAQIVAQLPLYKDNILYDGPHKLIQNEVVDLLNEAIQLLMPLND